MSKDQSAMSDIAARAEAAARSSSAGLAPAGSRDPLGSSFLCAVQADFAQHGVGVLARIREEKPETYLKLVSSILPKDLSAATGCADELSDEQLIERIQALDAAIRPLISGKKRAGGMRKRPPPAGA
ncbi:hypothetical protein GOL26_22565 [Sinorhizobium medicae]|nr:hypothetical protein [Sinorhizobium medicae]MDX1181096.1 hypothetical protein [Sinorhizobium medicae]